ncbi:MAG: sigma-70 family RNA polymerase sigma factor [Chloroflexi bacterium]|nr:sigma-70 family RNA polymerase sigma factor [Chloroflexota bacterium]
MVIDEKALLDRARAFDHEALGSIYDRYQPALYRYIYARTGNAAIAEDLSAEVFTRFLQTLRSGRHPPRSLPAWLYGTAHNLVADHYRERRPSAILLDESLAGSENSPLERLSDVEQVRAGVRQLSEDQQQVLILKFVEGLSNGEVAQVLGKNEGAVKALQFRALTRLAQLLRLEDSESISLPTETNT